MIKTLSGSTINYGATLPSTAGLPDGAMFFKTDYDADGVTNAPGFYVYSFQLDSNSNLIGEQVGMGWRALSKIVDFVKLAGDTMTGGLAISPVAGNTNILLNRSSITAGQVALNFSTAGTIGWQMYMQTNNPSLSFYSSALGTDVLKLNTDGSITTVNGKKVWTENNDGAGSGLDADLLDGKDSSFYLSAGNISGQVAINTQTTGTLEVARGGTGNTSTIAGGIVYGATTASIATSQAGAVGQVLISGGSATPTWLSQTSMTVGKALSVSAGGTANGTAMIFNWSGQSGQPTWLWGGNDGTNMNVYNPANFSVANANTVGQFGASTAATASTVVVRDSNNHIWGHYINLSSPNNESISIGQILVTNTSDNYVRKVSPSQLASAIGLSNYVAKAGDQMSGGLSVAVGVTHDPYGTIAATMPNNGNNYSYFGMTRSGQVGWNMGIQTDNKFFIGSGSGGVGVNVTNRVFALGTDGFLAHSGSLSSASGRFVVNSSGNIATINNISPPNGAIRLTPNLHLNPGAGAAVIAAWDNGDGGNAANLAFRIGNGAAADRFTVTYAGNANLTGSLWAGQNLTCGGTVEGAWLHSTGDMHVNGTLYPGAITCTNEIRGGYIHSTWDIRAEGTIYSVNDVVAYVSDGRLKTNVTKIQNAISKVISLGGYEYDWDLVKSAELGFTPSAEHEHGLIAQEVEKVLPDAVTDSPIGNGYKTVKYHRVVPLLVAAIREQQEQIEELKALVEKLISK